MFGLMRIVSMLDSRRALMAWDPVMRELWSTYRQDVSLPE